ncbi:hypothetical protein [Yokenella regensburgei]|uniref:hypothetical protein n=1 Tax=Yokenella regensburgei TaxID=158877 RepID=UPI0035AE7116
MKEFKGTPGPWVMDDYGNVLHETEAGSVGKLRVSGVRLPNRVTEEYAANTKLIAAAPDLLEALQNMIGAFDNPIVRRKLPSDFNSEAIQSARAAISKALGEG